MGERLTARRIETLKPPASGRIELRDLEVRGLTFRVTARGERTWTLRARFGGRNLRYNIGSHPDMGLAEAREAAALLRSQLRQGVDPREVERERKEAEEAKNRREGAERETRLTRKRLAAYYDQHMGGLANGRTWYNALERAFGEYLDRPLEEVTTPYLQAHVDALAAAGRKTMANRVRSHIRHFTGWCVRRGFLAVDVGKGVERPHSEVPRDRVLSVGELAAIWGATYRLGETDTPGKEGRAARSGEVWGPFVRFLLLTSQRFGDVSGLEWGHITGETWTQPTQSNKSRRAHVVHLSAPALDELEAVGRGRVRRGLVFTFGGGRLTASNALKRKLDALCGVTDWTFHDFRTAFATQMAERGHAEGVVDRVLNHAASGSKTSAVARAYQRSELLPQRRAALDAWGALVLGAVGKPPSVVDMAERGVG